MGEKSKKEDRYPKNIYQAIHKLEHLQELELELSY
jgi:hypothetical protein